jgi:hypothetical protein
MSISREVSRRAGSMMMQLPSLQGAEEDVLQQRRAFGPLVMDKSSFRTFEEESDRRSCRLPPALIPEQTVFREA